MLEPAPRRYKIRETGELWSVYGYRTHLYFKPSALGRTRFSQVIVRLQRDLGSRALAIQPLFQPGFKGVSNWPECRETCIWYLHGMYERLTIIQDLFFLSQHHFRQLRRCHIPGAGAFWADPQRKALNHVSTLPQYKYSILREKATRQRRKECMWRRECRHSYRGFPKELLLGGCW